MSTSDMDGGEEPVLRILVPASRASLAAIAVFSGAFTIGWLWFGITALRAPGLSAWLVFPVSMVAAAICATVCVWATRRRTNVEPALIVDEVGIFDNVSYAQGGRIRWRDMDRAWIAGPKWLQFLCIVPEEIQSYLSSQGEWKSFVMRLNKSVAGAPVIVPMAVLDRPQEQVWQEIVHISRASKSTQPPSNMATG